MIQFKRYNSIEYIFNNDFIENIRLEGIDKQEYVVQEKVHGSNICFVTDGETVCFGKRSGFVEGDENFYEHEKLLDRYRFKIIALFSIVKENISEIETVTIFGEMFGGNYPHPKVKNDLSIPIIQKGVFYSPEHDFYAFDIYVTSAKNEYFLTVDKANAVLEQGGFLYAKTLFRGTFEDCIQYPNDFTSLIPDWLDLPPIEDNICEGIIVRPVTPSYLSDGTQVLLKSKNEYFLERRKGKRRVRKLFLEPSYSELLINLLPIAEEYVTENRLDNVVSKIGQISIPRDTGKLIGLFSKDILDDFLKEHSGECAAIEKNEQKILNKHIHVMATDMIKEVYFKV